MIRHRLTDEQWERIEHLVPGKPGDPGRSGKDNRLFVDAVIWMARTGAPWRDLSPFFGKRNSVGTHPSCGGRRFRSRIAHYRRNNHPGAPTCGRRKRGVQEQAIGRSRGGLSTKIHIVVDALGNVLRLLYTAGQVHESTKAEALIAGLPAENLIGDKAFDSDRFRAHLADRGTTAVIPSNASRACAIPYDCHLYKERHLVEIFINKIKHFRRIATRYDKTIASYASFVAVAAFMLWMR